MSRFLRCSVSFLVVLLFATAAAGGDDPKFRPAARHGVADSYLVVLDPAFATGRNGRPDLPAVAALRAELAHLYRFRTEQVWAHALAGFSIVASEEEAKRLARDPKVLWVEQDARVPESVLSSGAAPYCTTQCLAYYDPEYTSALPKNTRPLPTSPQAITCSDPEPGANAGCIDNWGIDRCDQPLLPRDASYTFTQTGTNVHVYVVDTGIVSTHREVAGRIGNGVNLMTVGGNLEDCICHHHGTAVAAAIGGRTYGIAKNVTLHPVKVLDFCHGAPGLPSVSTYVSAFNWIVQNHQANGGPSVANLSGANWPEYVGSVSFANAVRGLINSGVSFVQSAGNQGESACSYSVIQADSTVNVAGAIVVGAVTELRKEGSLPLRNGRWVADYSDPSYGGTQYSKGQCVNRAAGARPDHCGSNYGSCVTLWAPGQWIVAAGWDNTADRDKAFCLMTGTSLAAPHVTGVIALYLQNHPTATPAQVKAALLAGAMPNVLQTSGPNSILSGSPNLLLQMLP